MIALGVLGLAACALAKPQPQPRYDYHVAGLAFDPTNAPTPTITVSPTPSQVGTVVSTGIDAWLAAAGWPAALIPQAEAVACGIGNANWPSGESGCNPAADNGRDLGMFQIDPGWFAYCGTDLSRWADPVVNAVTALCVYRYDLAHGEPGWGQWQVQP